MAKQRKNRLPKSTRIINLSIRIILSFFVFAAFGYVLIGSFADEDNQFEQSFTIDNPKLIKQNINQLPELRMKHSEEGSIENITRDDTAVYFQENYGEGSIIRLSGYWVDENVYMLMIIAANDEIRGNWKYIINQNELTIQEMINTQNLGFKTLLFFSDSFLDMEKEFELLLNAYH